MHELSKRDARRIAVRAQLLTAQRPASLAEVVRENSVAPNPDLVLWSRLGSAYPLEELEVARDQLWDLTSRVYPDDPTIPSDEALRTRNELRLHSLGLARLRGPECHVEPEGVADAGEPAVVEAVRGQWRIDPSYLGGAPFTGRTALLAPLDRKSGVLRVDAVHEDEAFTKTLRAAVHPEIRELAAWLELDVCEVA